MMWLNPGMSGCLIVAHTTLTKMMMTILWRGPGSAAAKMGADNWFAVKDKLEKLPGYEIMSATQKKSNAAWKATGRYSSRVESIITSVFAASSALTSISFEVTFD